MAETTETPLKIQFDEHVHHPTRAEVEGKNVNMEKMADEEDEENARRIAEQDLLGSRKQTYSGFVLMWLAFQSTGVIYGDIGTSPLYVYSSTFSSQPSWDDLVGALSIIIWSLTLIVTVKYTFIVLSADDDGEGGTFALYSLLARYANITVRGPLAKDGVKMERYMTGDLRGAQRGLRTFLERSPVSQYALKVVGVLGVAMVMSDGVLTPAQSVLGAIQGLEVVKPDFGTSAIVGITCGILVCLFLIQPFGVARLGTVFAPIVTVWLLFNLVSGIHNLALHDYTVLKAFSPYFAFHYLIRNGYDGWKSLGGLLLAFTGVEALFADLGAFSKRAIQMSWLCLAYPCLLLAYIGQAAYIAQDASGTAYQNPFFNTVPPGTFYFSLVIAILAAIVASQAMITSTFQLLIQVMRMSYFPHIKVVHTSKQFHEQVYMPLANWLLMIGTVIVTAVYNNTTSLGNAYGVCVIFVTFITTCMVTLVAIVVWRFPVYLVLPVFLIFAALDGVYLTAVLTKVPDGAWFTLVLAVILSSIFILWRFGKESQWSAESQDRLRPSALLVKNAESTGTSTGISSSGASSTLRLTPAFHSTPVSTVPGLGIFFDKSGDPDVLPPSFTHFVRKFAARPSVIVFFHMRSLPVPAVPAAERFVITRTPGNVLESSYSVVLRHGYTEDPLRPELARELVAEIELVASRRGHNRSGTIDGRDDASINSELAAVREAADAQTVYVLGKEAMRIRKAAAGAAGKLNPWRYLRIVLLQAFLWIRENSRAKLADLDIDADKVIEVGFLSTI